MKIPRETSERIAGSYKDPSGFVFMAGEQLYRQVNQVYASRYDHLMKSGLYEALLAKHWLVSHSDTDDNFTQSENCYKTLRPETIPFISYPYEWTGSQLRDAGILTLLIMRKAMEYGMMLKDATPYNVQFHSGRPVFIDTLSFDWYDASKPWIAYRQFCETILYPLLLEKYTGIPVHHWLTMHPDGVPATTAASLLPFKSRFNAGVYLHVFLPASVARKGKAAPKTIGFNRQKMLNLLQHLEIILRKTGNLNTGTTWSNYYDETILGQEYLKAKETIFRNMLTGVDADTVLDLGANNGYFSRILAESNRQVIATDFDHMCIHHLHVQTKKEKIRNILPLVLDITNPSAASGFNNTERPAFHQRIKTKLVTALALVHHLAISRNIPLPQLAAYFNGIAPRLIIEFPSKEDEKVQLLLSNREDIFHDYHETGFEAAFGAYYMIEEKFRIPGSHRTLYLMNRK